MQFNPDTNKQANELIFSRKSKVHSYPPLTFNNNDVKKCPHQKHLGIVLDSKQDFNIHVDSVFREKLYLPSKSPSSDPSKNPSSDHIWTMETSYMINQKIKVFKIN